MLRDVAIILAVPFRMQQCTLDGAALILDIALQAMPASTSVDGIGNSARPRGWPGICFVLPI